MGERMDCSSNAIHSLRPDFQKIFPHIFESASLWNGFPVCTGATSDASGRKRAKRPAGAFIVRSHTHTHTQNQTSHTLQEMVRCLIHSVQGFFSLSVQNNKSSSITCAGGVQMLLRVWREADTRMMRMMMWGSYRSAAKKPKINTYTKAQLQNLVSSILI